MTAAAPLGRSVVARGLGGDGRPLRFLMVVVGGWTGARIALLWSDPIAERTMAARGERSAATRAATPVVAAPLGLSAPGPEHRASTTPSRGGMATVDAPTAQLGRSVTPDHVATSDNETTAPPARITPAAERIAHALPPGGDAAKPIAPTLPNRSRWSGSAWALVRGSGAAAGVATPQLGGGQVGARVAYRLDASGSLAAVARVAAALGTRQQEGAFGIEWQPTRLPLRIVAERRIGIANVRGGPALGLVGGVSAVPLGAGFHGDGYMQAGVVARDRTDAYVDGALVAGRTIAAHGRTRIDLGLGAWGAAQRGAVRLDLGPSAVLVLPLERQAVRIGVQWRERVAGNARPGSGAVLSLGTDF